MARDLVAVNEQGRLIGESHPRAKLTDHDVDLIRELAEYGMSYRELARKFECDESTIRRIVSCERRGSTPDRYKPAATRPDVFKAEVRLNQKTEEDRVSVMRRLVVQHGSTAAAIRFLIDQHVR